MKGGKKKGKKGCFGWEQVAPTTRGRIGGLGTRRFQAAFTWHSRASAEKGHLWEKSFLGNLVELSTFFLIFAKPIYMESNFLADNNDID